MILEHNQAIPIEVLNDGDAMTSVSMMKVYLLVLRLNNGEFKLNADLQGLINHHVELRFSLDNCPGLYTKPLNSLPCYCCSLYFEAKNFDNYINNN